MKMLDLNSYGVVEMTQQEMLEVEGGAWHGKAFKAVGDAFIAVGKFFIAVGKAIDAFCAEVAEAFDSL
jgi:hypothetical protein